MKKNVKKFNKRLRQEVNFESLGFQDFEHDDFFYSWELHRESREKVDYLRYTFSRDKWKDEMFLHPPKSSIIFQKVNQILMSLDNKQPNNNVFEPTIIELPDFDKKGTGNYYDIAKLLFVKNKIVNEEIFKEALALFKEQLATTVLPFFDKIQTLQQVNDEILEKVDWNTYNKYISGESGAKVLIIMKLCNNPRYEAYKQRSDELIAEQLKDPNYAQYTGILQNQQIIMDEVYNYLESNKYLDVIDE